MWAAVSGWWEVGGGEWAVIRWWLVGGGTLFF